MSKEEKKLRVESEHALFVAKCIYEKAKEDVDTRAGGLLHGWLSLAKLREICNQLPYPEHKPEPCTFEEACKEESLLQKPSEGEDR